MTKNPIEIFKDFSLDIEYSIPSKDETAFLVYRGKGSTNLNAEDHVYYADYDYTIEYYFKYKDEERERAIEARLDEAEVGWYKSGDVYIEEEDMFVIYYNI